MSHDDRDADASDRSAPPPANPTAGGTGTPGQNGTGASGPTGGGPTGGGPTDRGPTDPHLLSAFVDGELSADERARVLEQIAKDPDAAARVAAWQSQKAALRALVLGPHADGTAQPGSKGTFAAASGAAQTAAAQPAANDASRFIVVKRRAPWWQHVGMAACWILVGAGLTLTAGPFVTRALRGSGVEPMTFARRADVAYAVYSPEVRHPVEVAANEEAHLVAWLSKRLGRQLSVPSLQSYGYTLVGGRLLPGESGPAAQFMYENASGGRLTLYVTGMSRDETAFRLLRDGNRRTFYWINDRMGYALSGPIGENKLREIAIDVCADLGGQPRTWQ